MLRHQQLRISALKLSESVGITTLKGLDIGHHICDSDIVIIRQLFTSPRSESICRIRPKIQQNKNPHSFTPVHREQLLMSSCIDDAIVRVQVNLFLSKCFSEYRAGESTNVFSAVTVNTSRNVSRSRS